MLKNVFYINLEYRTDRRRSVEEQLTAMGWEYERFNAIKHTNGLVGCGKSHIGVVQLAKERDLDYVVVIEDDIEFMNPEWFKEQLARFLAEEHKYDVLMFSANVLSPCIPIRENLVRVLEAQVATGYIVKKHYYDTYLENLREANMQLEERPWMHHYFANDRYWIKLQQRDMWLLITPRTVSQLKGFSDNGLGYCNYHSVLLGDVPLKI